MNILGIDIGYSNLKIAFGNKDEGMKTLLRPAGAAPEGKFGIRADGRKHEFMNVLVGEERYIAGVPFDRAEMWERSLHANYSNSTEYTALMHAGLLLSEMEKIDMLVTGLPVFQFYDENKRLEIENRFKGVHQITPKRSVEVKNVKVIAQPVGGFIDYVSQQERDENDFPIDENTRVLVVDPGFFSLDWVLIANGQLQKGSSGTSLKASSVLLENASDLISKDYGGRPSVESLENAIRENKPSILVAGQRVDIQPYIQKSSQEMVRVTVGSLQKSMRLEATPPDIVVMVGGGASFFKDAVQDAFQNLKVITQEESVFSPVRGFWLMGAYSNK